MTTGLVDQLVIANIQITVIVSNFQKATFNSSIDTIKAKSTVP